VYGCDVSCVMCDARTDQFPSYILFVDLPNLVCDMCVCDDDVWDDVWDDMWDVWDHAWDDMCVIYSVCPMCGVCVMHCYLVQLHHDSIVNSVTQL